MQRFDRCNWRILAMVSAGVGMALMCGCSTFEESGLPGSASSMARNQIMYVRKEPVSFGYYRLSSQMEIYPDLGVFLKKNGTPDFLAETADGDRSYFIFYYLSTRRAYACRSRPGQPGTLEFSGPYPVTRKEYHTLDRVRKAAKP